MIRGMSNPIKFWPGMSFGDFLVQEVPDDWPKEEFYWQPTLWTRITICKECGSHCAPNVKWMPKTTCRRCPTGYDGGEP